MKKLLVLILSCASSLSAAATPSVISESGPHGVGLRIVQQYDYSREMEVQTDAFGKPLPTGRGRPIQTLVWYPAKRTQAVPMQAADYLAASLSDVDFSFPAAATAKQRAGWMSGPQKSQHAASTLAVRDAVPVAGSYPVVIFAPSFAAAAHENLDLCEYLASHGYVVIASRSLGPRSVMMTEDVEGVDAQAADIAFLVNYAQTLPEADITKVAAMGFSWGGMANVFAAARSSRIKALVSIDGSIRSYPKIWSAAGYVRPVRTPVPILFLGARSPTAEAMERDDKFGPSYLNTMKYSDVYVTTMHPMTHMDFSSWHLRLARDDAFGDYQRAEVLQAYRAGARYVHRFLDAYLKNDAAALAFMKQSPARHGIGPQVMSMEFRPASVQLLGEADFLQSFSKAGFKDAQTIYTKMIASSPDFSLSPPNLNKLGYQLLGAKNARGAVELFKLATHIEPNYGAAFDSEGEAYEALGDPALAIAAYEKAVAVDKSQLNAMDRIKFLRSASAK